MVKETIVLSDICKERKAATKCFLCGKDICEDHNFGGKYSSVSIHAVVYNDRVFNIEIEDIFMDCCSDCTDILRYEQNEKGEILKNKLKRDLKNIKSFLLDEIKKKDL